VSFKTPKLHFSGFTRCCPSPVVDDTESSGAVDGSLVFHPNMSVQLSRLFALVVFSSVYCNPIDLHKMLYIVFVVVVECA
jgi:hypothetical protein